MIAVERLSKKGDEPAKDSRTTATLANTVAATAYANHLSCWRSSPVDRRNRKNGEMLATSRTASPPRYMGGAEALLLKAWTAGIAIGLGKEGEERETWTVVSNMVMIIWAAVIGT